MSEQRIVQNQYKGIGRKGTMEGEITKKRKGSSPFLHQSHDTTHPVLYAVQVLV